MKSTERGKKRSFKEVENSEEFENKVFGNVSVQSKKKKLNSGPSEVSKESNSVWVDPDDSQLTVNLGKKLKHLRATFTEKAVTGDELVDRQRKNYNTINKDNDWATIEQDKKKSESEEEEEQEKRADQKQVDTPSDGTDMFTTSARFVVFEKNAIPPNNIASTDLGEINGKSPHQVKTSPKKTFFFFLHSQFREKSYWEVYVPPG
ncbi:hypothetical protein RFI_08263 [Reticulomyxa filosa]|uniref:Uncharacterized protein n=1 Tax=Reticulomyxa filosa TaxID=46433 RepID=X6NRG2_RETFI|nr:hypothetical protein RFI_08263 [Reticulomyxa filosa]|eukprot:ETO28865.1 hypothetical protein RFI_08263 [Reticulomyxa filosa]